MQGFAKHTVLAILSALLTVLVAGGCTSVIPASAVAGGEAVPQAAAAGQDTDPEGRFETFDHSLFDESSIHIDNEWWPLTPGTQFVFDGSTVEDGEEVPHRIVFTVTDLTKEIHGVNAVVVWDRDFSEDRLVESELAFFAQDKMGNVWHLGQYREMYDEIEFVGGRVWLVGHLEGARAGIMMQAEPRMDPRDYSQGFAPSPFNWTDRARVFEMGQKYCAPVGCYEDVLVVEEYNDEEPGAFQYKYYARGVGNVGVGFGGDDAQKETLELVDILQLDPEALAEVRADALKLEERAYIYATTPPATAR